ncbi:F-box/FBD/LRR-repeat protein At3g52680-like [Neltuma alba]|uniref:F-box/FBD/LRR-repeat protein At3g52680-like n=1 Tax=Neltuma alba TaxID=207710 RepID=UPI0010A5544A|nr:F-box/FBD/LRR-repeat protein At3g52680-like [Prosopis alba]
MSDRISNLPDSLLLHILSSKYLQTKDVIATMLLSKIWKSLWLSIPKLEFYEKGFRSYESFLQFIDSTLNLVDSKSLKMFSLKCEYFDMPHDKVDIWVNTVLKSKLEYLNLCFAPCFDIMVTYPPLPSSTFNSNTIRILKLVRVKVSNLSTVNLPSLKALHMMYVVFSDAESLGMLLSKCVRLQELLLLYLGFPDDENMKLDIGRLHHLVIAKVSSVDLFRMEVFSNVTFLSLEEHDFFPGDYEFPTFYNLPQLEIHYLTQKGWSSLVCCLRSFPKLETLIIYEGCKGLDWSMEAGPDNVPPCVSSNLKVFVLGGFNYLQSEFEILDSLVLTLGESMSPFSVAGPQGSKLGRIEFGCSPLELENICPVWGSLKLVEDFVILGKTLGSIGTLSGFQGVISILICLGSSYGEVLETAICNTG